MEYSSFLEKIYLNSLTPFEILEVNKQFNCHLEKNEHCNYLDYWKKSISKDGSEDIFDKYCFGNNLSKSDTSLMISNVSGTSKDIVFPVWVFELEEILNQIDVDFIISKTWSIQEAFYPLFLPYIDYFSKKLNQSLTASNIVLNNELVDQLSLALYRDLFDLANLVLFDEFNEIKKAKLVDDLPEDFYYKKFVSDNLFDRYQRLFLKYPMLAKKLTTKTYQYLNFITNLFKKFYADKPELESLFNIMFGLINKIYLNSGDQHNGESTVILEFENKYKIVYKPINVGITNAYNTFLNWINENIDEELKNFKILDKGTYGWLEFVENSQCDSIIDVKLYYKKAGILLGLAYFLNAKDFHFENIIASGNCPVLIDHETILSPEFIQLSKENEEPEDHILRTVLESSLIPVKDSGLPFYMYGFGSSILIESEMATSKIRNCNIDTMEIIIEMKIEKLQKLNKPFYNEISENLINYQEEFKDGFQKLYYLILKNKNYLLSENSPVNNFCNFKIRFINRPTKVYSKILKFLNKPEYLADSIKYGIKLEILARAYILLDDRFSILESEREQMLKSDIPVFYINTLDSDINLPNKNSINLIKLNAIENIYDKIRNASVEDFNNQMILIEESITL